MTSYLREICRWYADLFIPQSWICCICTLNITVRKTNKMSFIRVVTCKCIWDRYTREKGENGKNWDEPITQGAETCAFFVFFATIIVDENFDVLVRTIWNEIATAAIVSRNNRISIESFGCECKHQYLVKIGITYLRKNVIKVRLYLEMYGFSYNV